MATETLDRKDKKETGFPTLFKFDENGIVAGTVDAIEGYLKKVAEQDEARGKRAAELLAPTKPTKELLAASWEAALAATSEYSRAYHLKATNLAEATRIVNEARLIFLSLPADVQAGALIVLHVQAEKELAQAQATKGNYDLAA